MDEKAEFEREMTKAAEMGETMVTAMKVIRDLIEGGQLFIMAPRGDDDGWSAVPVASVGFDGPTRILLGYDD